MLFIIIALVILIGGLILASLYRDSKYEDHSRFRIAVRTTAIILALVIGSFSAIAIVPSGYTGLRTVFGVVNEDSLVQGFSFIIPVAEHIVLIDNRQQPVEVKDQIWSESLSQTAVYASGVVATYTITPAASAWVYTNVRDYEHNLISKEMISSAVKIATRSTKTEDVTSREVVEPKVLQALQEDVDERYGEGSIIINAVVIADMDFEEEYSKSISERQQALIAQEQQSIRNQTAIEKAESDAKVKRTTADAEAYSITTKAKAEAEANTELGKTISSNILEYNEIQAWDGKLPYVIDGDTIPIISFDSGVGTSIAGPNTIG